LLAALGAADCGGSDSVAPDAGDTTDFSDLTAEILTSCTDPASQLAGIAVAGASCTGKGQCAPACCPCLDGSGKTVSWTKASDCQHSKCATEESTCAPATGSRNPWFCL
jgi:hypothetical protein